MKNKKLLAALLTLLIFLSPTFAAAETVVTSFYPIYLFALNLTQGIDGITIRNLAAPNTGCLHDYQLSTGDMKVLNKAVIKKKNQIEHTKTERNILGKIDHPFIVGMKYAFQTVRPPPLPHA